jgi:hypothetical protein
MSHPVIATLTLEAINAAMEKDQGATFRRYLKETIPKAEDVFREDNGSGLRTHLGASIIGKDCDRELWYTFRWASLKKHGGKLLRLFNRGHLEEPRFLAMLKMIGCQVWTHDGAGNQYRFKDHGGHFAGSTDGVVKGIPDRPDVPLLLEFKTHGEKSFLKVQAEGVRNAKFDHYIQMQMYMGSMNLSAALYMAVNKNDDDLYAEIVDYNHDVWVKNHARAGKIIHSGFPPAKISQSPGWFQCKMCDYAQICHFKEPLQRSCRTCQSVVPMAAGGWRCERFGTMLSKDAQIKACDEYIQLPH